MSLPFSMQLSTPEPEHELVADDCDSLGFDFPGDFAFVRPRDDGSG